MHKKNLNEKQQQQNLFELSGHDGHDGHDDDDDDEGRNLFLVSNQDQWFVKCTYKRIINIIQIYFFQNRIKSNQIQKPMNKSITAKTKKNKPKCLMFGPVFIFIFFVCSLFALVKMMICIYISMNWMNVQWTLFQSSVYTEIHREYSSGTCVLVYYVSIIIIIIITAIRKKEWKKRHSKATYENSQLVIHSFNEKFFSMTIS